ncbi:T9SS type A sorting domain-containing protein [Oscillatoria sp. FACHB-1407]|uniref:T9SS type A sorting domain-containing protein n=1 Tax=Oscillatoria sp. FACHB-1407 TaxID=2692847 RepID=UPI0016821FC4|nr:T9SS type A sorting domain-containing protein [Oscillatoria sp. FACHB-1407]MBD2462594.1 T9SS type A sorting domain-containing protein [Oscillatoria sp. FACHB-1407]
MAREILEIEGTTVNVGSVENGGVVVKNGQIGVGSDTRDLYQIDITRPTQLTTLLVPKSANANLRLFDTNGNIFSSSREGTSNDAIFNPNLPVGTYFIEVTGSANTATNYDLSIIGAAVTNAQMGVTVDRIRSLATSKFEFLPFDQPDFFIESIVIDGNRSGSSRTFNNQADARPNFSFTRAVSNDDQIIRGEIIVRENDTPLPAQLADISPDQFSPNLTFNLDALQLTVGELFSFSPRSIERPITLQGGGDNPFGGFLQGNQRAAITFRVNYSAFTSSSTFNQLNRSTTTKGDNRSNTIVGNNRNGILDGGRGADDLSGMGGNDALIGNFGTDTLRGGAGRDITWGSQGNDTYYGGVGRDTFVLDLLRGVDVIKDYKDGVDKIGLTNGIVYELLDIRREGRNSGIFLGDQKLGVVENTRPRDLTADDFKSISFVTIKDIVTPQVMA